MNKFNIEDIQHLFIAGWNNGEYAFGFVFLGITVSLFMTILISCHFKFKSVFLRLLILIVMFSFIFSSFIIMTGEKNTKEITAEQKIQYIEIHNALLKRKSILLSQNIKELEKKLKTSKENFEKKLSYKAQINFYTKEEINQVMNFIEEIQENKSINSYEYKKLLEILSHIQNNKYKNELIKKEKKLNQAYKKTFEQKG